VVPEPELLAGDVPVEVPCDILSAHKSKYVGVIMIRELKNLVTKAICSNLPLIAWGCVAGLETC
jgi:hypothetical protein